jgi:hypothetical protein
MRWPGLSVEAELASGVVVLKPPAPLHFVIKPGSYMWPEEILCLPRP